MPRRRILLPHACLPVDEEGHRFAAGLLDRFEQEEALAIPREVL